MLPVPSRSLVGRIMFAIGAAGAVVSLVAIVVGLRFLSQLETALEASLDVSVRSLTALDSSVALAQDTVVRIEDVLVQTAATSDDVAGAIADASAALEGVADLSEEEIAGSLAAVERSLPALIDVAGVIDRTLGALNRLPFGPDYDPAEPFDDSLRAVQQEIDGLPEGLRDQAALIRTGQASLRDVGDGIGEMSRDLSEMTAALRTAGTLLGEYASTTEEARRLVTDSDTTLSRQLTAARWLVFGMGLIVFLGQAVPLGVGWFLLRPEAAEAFLAT